jgi:eukaryotic-like serine/threonine-protein kinase
VMLFQMLAGVLPFRGESMAELMYKIANEDAADARTLRPELSVAVANVVALSLSKRPETRFQDGEQFAADLRLAITSERAVAAPPASRAAPASQVAAAAHGDGFAATRKIDMNSSDFEKTVVSTSRNPGIDS